MRERDYYPEEEWRTIKDFESYKVSSFGRVMNSHGVILLQKPNRKGYLRVWLYNKNVKHKQFFVHRLVAQMFIPNSSNLPMINHKDENRTNNHCDNLEWCNNTYNQRYSRAKTVNQYNLNGELLKSWNAISDIAQETSIPTTNISKCCKGIIKTINGYIFLYEGDSIINRLDSLKYRKHKSKSEML